MLLEESQPQGSMKDHTAGLRLTALNPESQGTAEGDTVPSLELLPGPSTPLGLLLSNKHILGFKCFRNSSELTLLEAK